MMVAIMQLEPLDAYALSFKVIILRLVTVLSSLLADTMQRLLVSNESVDSSL